MPKKTRNLVDDLRGASKLATDATQRVTDVVEDMHTTIGSGPAILGKPLAGPVGLINSLVYGGVRGVTQVVGASIDRALEIFAPMLNDSEPGPEREVAIAVLNGVIGDHLTETENPLAIEMRLRLDGHPLTLETEALKAAFPQAGSRLLVLVHGSCANDLMWSRAGHDHGASLARDLDLTPLYVHYNSGLHVSTNGRQLDALLESLVSAWPAPIDEIVLLTHSMGGLLARSAWHYGESGSWRSKISTLVCIGTPHHGAPLERGGNGFEVLLGVFPYSAPLARLGRLRSAGITDLRFGNLLDEHWQGRDRFAPGKDARGELTLPEGVACYAMAGTLATEGQTHPLGDGMVPVDSALGRHDETHQALDFPEANQWIGYELGHLDLLCRPDVYDRLLTWLSSPTR
jgi:pimeloyl-ACP methyl ester carboxylesterase